MRNDQFVSLNKRRRACIRQPTEHSLVILELHIRRVHSNIQILLMRRAKMFTARSLMLSERLRKRCSPSELRHRQATLATAPWCEPFEHFKMNICFAFAKMHSWLPKSNNKLHAPLNMLPYAKVNAIFRSMIGAIIIVNWIAKEDTGWTWTSSLFELTNLTWNLNLRT